MQQTTKQVSRGLRNNNPLNIRRGGDRWQGSTRVQKDPDFVTFKELKWGYRAAWKVLATYSRRFAKDRKPFNLFHILSQWAPETDGNNVRAYVHAVMKLGGIGGREHFPQSDCVSGYRRLTVVELPTEQAAEDTQTQGVGLSDIGRGLQHVDKVVHLGFGLLRTYVVFCQQLADDGGDVSTVCQGTQDGGARFVQVEHLFHVFCLDVLGHGHELVGHLLDGNVKFQFHLLFFIT